MLRTLALLLALVPIAGALSSTAQDRAAPTAPLDLAPLGRSLSDYAEARDSGAGFDAARAALARSLEALRAQTGEHPLRRWNDLGRALSLARTAAAEEGRALNAGRVVEDTLGRGSFDGKELKIAYRVPADYDPRAREYAMILAIPGADEDPAQHLRANWTLPALLDGAILVSPEMPADAASWESVMIDGRPGGLSHVLTALRQASERFAVDFDRIYVAGRGIGVAAALAAGNSHPQRFAGVIGRAGDASELAPDNFGNLPTYFAGSGARASEFARALGALGFDNCTLDPTGKEDDLWNWMLEHPRVTYPERVTLAAGNPFPTRAYWLRIAPSAVDARASAELERASNTVRVAAAGVSHVTLYLNDALLDLERPVHVICNGVDEVVSVVRSIPGTLDMIEDGTSDPACVYVAETFHEVNGERPAPVAGAADLERAFEERFAKARGDVESLWALYGACLEEERPERARRALGWIVRLDPDNAQARAALGHVQSGERWFSSAGALERFERGQEEAVAKSRGWVRHKSLWVHPDERALASKGWEKDPETGQWLTLDERKQLADGWVRQDLAWIPPEEAGRVDDGLWLVDGEWLDLAAANRRHARIESMWRIPSAEVWLHTTTDRDVALRAQRVMQDALEDLRRVFGAEPVLPLAVALLRDEEQYDRFAFGDPDGRRPATHAGRLHVIHSAFFAESWFPRVAGKREFAGLGVGYWDTLAPYGNEYGLHSARLAIGLSFVDALDPSPKAVRRALSDKGGGSGGDYYEAYYKGKTLPAWLRYGGAVYAERYFRDPHAAEGSDPWWARVWSLQNLAERGGLRPLGEVFAFELDPDDRDDGLKLFLEAGLLVAFALDGGCEPVVEAHGDLQRALLSGRLSPNHGRALADALTANEATLRAFAGE